MRKTGLCLLAVAALALAGTEAGYALFGSNGWVLTSISSGNDFANSVAVQADSKIVAAGRSANATDFDFSLARYNSNGTLDTDFGTNGVVVTPIGAGDESIQALALQGDGKIVVAGYSDNGSNNDFVLARYNGSGALDTDFGTNGVVVTPVGAGDESIQALALQGDGKIVVAGYSDNGSNNDFVLARYNGSGALDTDFGTNGVVVTPIGAGDESIQALVLLGDGKIVVAGYSDNGSNNDFALARYNGSGALDTDFGTNGVVTTPVGSQDDAAYALALQGDGKLVAAGYSDNGSNDVFALARYNSNGTLDTTFSGDGKQTTVIGTGDSSARALILQPDGKLAAAGSSYISASHRTDFALARYNGSGALDTDFGVSGVMTVEVGDSYCFDSAQGLARQTDGRLVAAGSSDNSGGGTYYYAVLRVNADGSLDNTPDTPTPTITPTATVSPTPSVSPTISPTPSVTPTGTPLTLRKDEIKLYPQPARSRFYLAVAISGPAEITVDVYNLAGERVLKLEDQPRGDSGAAVLEVMCPALGPGVYFAHVRIRDAAGERQLTRRLAIIR